MANDLSGGWIDVSVSLHSGMVHWPDNPPVQIERVMSFDRGDAANVSKISMGSHTGTHMDAPIHFVPDGEGINMLPLDAAMGAARVIASTDAVSIKRAELEPYDIQRGERILFKTRNSNRVWNTDNFVEDFVYISADAAEYLAERGARTVGVDYLSVGGYKQDGIETHYALLGAGIWIIEGLNLASVEPGNYELVCLPLKIVDGDGAPARAIVRPIGK
ncbi:MAG TPA: cyclase family protein [Ktedonobacterales bacterium]